MKSRFAPVCTSAPFGRSLRKTQGDAGLFPELVPRSVANRARYSMTTPARQSLRRRGVSLKAASNQLSLILNTILQAEILFDPVLFLQMVRTER